jgi:hypothetical protein
LVTIEVSKVFKYDDAEFTAAGFSPASGTIKVTDGFIHESRP